MTIDWFNLLENFNDEKTKTYFISYLKENHKNIRFAPYNGQEYNALNAAIIVLRYIAKHDKIINQKISDLVPDIENISEKIYFFLTKMEKKCVHGLDKRFDDFAIKYKFCKRYCPCYTENMKNKYESKDLEEKEKIKLKRAQTTKERFGVEHIMHSETMKNKVFETNIQKYGEKTFLATKENKENLKAICQERYGTDSPLESDLIKQKIIATNQERYGSDNFVGSDEWRKKYDEICDQRENEIGIRHYVQTEFKEKSKNTSLQNYGTSFPIQSKKHVDERQETQISKNGRITQHKNYSEKTLSILLDKEKFEDFMSTRSLYTAASELEVNRTTICNYRRLYEIPFGNSSYELEIQHWLSEKNIFCKPRHRGIKHNNGKSMEIDLFLPDYNVGIEINGLYYHSDKKISNDYHYNKWKKCNDNNIRLLMVPSNLLDENDKKQIIFNKILNLCGKTPSGLPARKLKVENTSFSICKNFVNKYHIQGCPQHVTASIGAYDKNNTLVAVMLFGRQRGTGILEMVRFCSDEYTHCGIFSKMLKHWRNMNSEPIVTFADLSYSSGELYRKTGFIEDKIINPDYHYVRGNQMFHKSNFTKEKIKKKYLLETITTEKETMESLGFSRYYDCGKIKFIYGK